MSSWVTSKMVDLDQHAAAPTVHGARSVASLHDAPVRAGVREPRHPRAHGEQRVVRQAPGERAAPAEREAHLCNYFHPSHVLRHKRKALRVELLLVRRRVRVRCHLGRQRHEVRARRLIARRRRPRPRLCAEEFWHEAAGRGTRHADHPRPQYALLGHAPWVMYLSAPPTFLPSPSLPHHPLT